MGTISTRGTYPVILLLVGSETVKTFWVNSWLNRSLGVDRKYGFFGHEKSGAFSSLTRVSRENASLSPLTQSPETKSAYCSSWVMVALLPTKPVCKSRPPRLPTVAATDTYKTSHLHKWAALTFRASWVSNCIFLCHLHAKTLHFSCQILRSILQKYKNGLWC